MTFIAQLSWHLLGRSGRLLPGALPVLCTGSAPPQPPCWASPYFRLSIMILNGRPRLLPEVVQSPINRGAVVADRRACHRSRWSACSRRSPEENFIEETLPATTNPRMASQKNDLGK